MPTEEEFFSDDFEDTEEHTIVESDDPEEIVAEEHEDDQLDLPLEESEPIDEEGEEEPEAEPARQPSRAERRFQTLANKAKEAEEKATRLEQELSQYRQPRAQQTDTFAEQRAYRAWYDTLSPEQQFMENARRTAEESSLQVQRLQRQVADGQDKADFSLYLANNPHYQKYSKLVEEKLNEIRRSGVDAQRRVVLTYVLGEAVEKAKVKPVSRNIAQANIKKQTTRVARSGNNVSSERRYKPDDMSLEALEARLKGRRLDNIWDTRER